MSPLSRLAITAVALAALLVGATSVLASNAAPPASEDATAMQHADARTNREAFRADMRKLWEDHITWTRLFIVSDVADLPDLQATTNRLLRNQDDIGDAVAAYYGRDAGDALTALLKEHILLAAQLLNAAKAGDSDGVNQASADWYANANEIGTFLHDANPRHWGLAEMQDMMRMHLDFTLDEAVAHLTGDFAADVAAYDKVHDEILEMADMLSDGIIAQFPEAFAN